MTVFLERQSTCELPRKTLFLFFKEYGGREQGSIMGGPKGHGEGITQEDAIFHYGRCYFSLWKSQKENQEGQGGWPCKALEGLIRPWMACNQPG